MEKRQIRVSGKTVDEAIFRGLNELEISIDEVDVEIVQNESKGVFGIGAKPAVVLLTVRDSIQMSDYLHTETTRSDVDSKTSRTERERHSGTTEERVDNHSSDQTSSESGSRAETVVAEKGRNEAASYEEPRRTEPRRQRYGDANRRSKPVVLPVKNIDYSEEFAKECEAAIFVKTLLDKMEIECKVLAAQDDEGIYIRIDSENAGILIGHRGETLDSIQYLTLLTVNKERKQHEYVRVTVDTEGYRQKRMESLTHLARMKASSVRKTGKPHKFEPMSPYERRILHSALQGNPFVTTHSEGDDPNRCVIISLKQRNRKNYDNH